MHYNNAFNRDQKKWERDVYSRAGILEKILRRVHAETEARYGIAQANKQLRESIDALRVHDIDAASDMDKLEKIAQWKVRLCQFADEKKIKRIGAAYGIEFPKKTTEEGVKLRAIDKTWWIRNLRKICLRRCEKVLRDIGLVHRFRGCYVSDFTLRRMIERDRKNRDILESLEAVNELGETYTLAELNELSVSNPEIRRGELMVRMRGFQEWAQNEGGWCNLFITITTPSRFHAYTYDGQKNEKYSGFTPSHGQQYLSDIWADMRAEFARNGVECFGFRIAEPHHDGTPHWHLSLFVKNNWQKASLVQTMRAHAMRVDWYELDTERKREARFKAVEIELGKAAGYIAKYVAKNIDGYEVGKDHENSEDSLKTCARVKAWASVWGIRQFQQIGGAGVTVWRKTRRIATESKQKELGLPVETGFDDILVACDTADWSGYTEAMGGATIPRKYRPAWLCYAEKEKAGKYREPVKIVAGVSCIWKSFINCVFHTWEIVSNMVVRAVVWPRSCVNNCTKKNRGAGARQGENYSFEWGFI